MPRVSRHCVWPSCHSVDGDIRWRTVRNRPDGSVAYVRMGIVQASDWLRFLYYSYVCLATSSRTVHVVQRCADCDCGRGYPRTRIRRFSCGRGRSADPPNKHICGRGPSADLKPRVLFALCTTPRPTSNECANAPVFSNRRTDPYLDTAVGYIRKPVWLCGALGNACLLDTEKDYRIG